jgi:hypothetical protein
VLPSATLTSAASIRSVSPSRLAVPLSRWVAPSILPIVAGGASASRCWKDDSGLVTATPSNCDKAPASCADTPSLKADPRSLPPLSASTRCWDASPAAGAAVVPASAANGSTAMMIAGSWSGLAVTGAGDAAVAVAAGFGLPDSPEATYPPASTASTPAATATTTQGLRGSGLIRRPSSVAKLHPVHGRRDAGSPPPVSAMAHGHATGRAAYAAAPARPIHRHAAPIR